MNSTGVASRRFASSLGELTVAPRGASMPEFYRGAKQPFSPPATDRGLSFAEELLIRRNRQLIDAVIFNVATGSGDARVL
jgi:hypothetical protein